MIYCSDTGDPRDRQLKRIFGLLSFELHPNVLIGCHITITRCKTYLTWSGGRMVQASAGLVIYAGCSITALGFVLIEYMKLCMDAYMYVLSVN